MSIFLKTLWFLVIMLNAHLHKAQFNNFYVTDQVSVTGPIEVHEATGNYIVPYYFVENFVNLGILTISPSGDLIDTQFPLENPSNLLAGRPQGFFSTSDGGYIVCAGNNGTYMAKLNENLQMEWQAAANDGEFNGYFIGKELYNGDIVTGYIDPDNPYNILNMRRFSAQGELLLEFEVNLEYDYSYPNSFAVKDSMVYVTFHRRLVGNPDIRRNYIVCYNAFTGEEVWEVHQIEDDSILAYLDPILTWNQQGELLFVFHQYEEVPLPGTLEFGFGKTMVAKVNLETGALADVTTVSPLERSITLYDAEVTDDGGMVILSHGVMGDIEELSPDYFGPRIAKLDADLQTEWLYGYFGPSPYDTSQDFPYLWDVEITNDDCIVAVGMRNGSSSADIGYYQYVWILKVDACGNEMVSDCTLSGVGELSQEQTITIYPNPARNRIFLKGENTIQRAMIYDLKGQLVHDEHFSGSLQQTLFIDHLPTGLYVVKAMTNEGEWSSKRIMVSGEHTR